MENDLLKVMGGRNKYVSILEEDIVKYDKELAEWTREKDEIENLSVNLKSLGKYPEKESLIPLAKNIYMKGNIVHTGEYYVKYNAVPDSYILLKTLDQTLHSLENKIETKQTDINKIKYAKIQQEERQKILKGGNNPNQSENPEESGTNPEESEINLPDKIESEKGIAVRVGNVYEILEFEDK